ncbi:hypothetical protein [Bacillus cereus]|uniref:hypothetical protein n=1 Tax=Bacillus cereus TaxID=1396 RepID=UPI00257093E0|nr:hypothetical protein [Bacillus cereus]WJE28135.1 hypothetical protein QRE65_15565 [Bacillus cereus]
MFSYEMQSKVEEALQGTGARINSFSGGANDTYTVKLHLNEEEEEYMITFRAYKTFNAERGDFMCVVLENNKDKFIANHLQKNLEYLLNK